MHKREKTLLCITTTVTTDNNSNELLLPLLIVTNPIYILGITFYGVEHLFGQFKSPLLAMMPSCASMAEHEPLSSL